MMSTPLAIIAILRRWARLASLAPFSPLKPSATGSNRAGSSSRPFGFWKIWKLDAS